MSRQVFLYDPPDRFVAGTVGLPGRRTFFLQASAGGRVTSVALEKTQVAALAERIDELLDEVVRRTGGNAPVPAVAPPENADSAPLEAPVDEEFRVGTMALAWDGEEQRMIVEAQALVELDAEDDEDLADAEERLLQDEENGPPMLRVRLDRGPGQGLRQTRTGCRQRGPAAVPAVQSAARPGRTRMSAPERIPPRSVTRWKRCRRWICSPRAN